jgi:hypothetical protein
MKDERKASPRSGRERKAWGCEPQVQGHFEYKARDNGRQMRSRSVTRFTGSVGLWITTWGSRPWLYAGSPLHGLSRSYFSFSAWRLAKKSSQAFPFF